jgi:predicted Zn-dependent peptidase
MLNEGTSEFSSAEIAEKIDFFGAFIGLQTGKHTSNLTIFTLNKHLNSTLQIVYKMLTDSVFPKKELKTFLLNELQQFNIDRQKTEVLAREEYYKTVFGKNHIYSQLPVEKDFSSVDTKELKTFFAKFYDFSNLTIIASGKICPELIENLNLFFGNTLLKSQILQNNFDFSIKNFEPKYVFVEKENAVQATIKIGKISINKKHEDFYNLSVTNTILGGYFGSRLMKNIREDKGYTYGIYSANMSMLNSGFFVISADAGKEVYKKAVDEVFKEIKILRTEKVSDLELTRVRNYLIGSFVANFDGAFALSQAFESIFDYDLGYDFYDKYLKAIQNITASEILETAEKYLREDTMHTVISCSRD